jgi:hypothetical protein
MLVRAPREHRLHAAAPQFAAVLVVVIAAIGDHLVGAPARPAAFARDGTDPIDQREQLRHVVAIPPVSAMPSGTP